ncbi:adenosylcobyric acid synthase (glutamine-hydrolysing) [Marinilabilia salmonicolor]|uniref:Cobyric acid synthase n=2 Tax=Marinilabilia salmonicolor TaxID=989 RepID=A0A2T0XBA4_9BACT|nr:adenosylcobyric acid synthase (glutamine-hydrolysing) [Marinilabilia salmonicolor]RCW35312.1 adenosylcobyric acid synthase (glutamine-hydrolysing) [Marinilabilia salmonicolor]
MVVGTGSDVGKSVLATGFCRIFLQDGYRPVPFKAQNMSLNSYVTANGGEIGRAQAVQAEACRLDCHTDMNPVLLKPGSDKQSQVIVNGKVLGNYVAGSYFRGEIKDQLFGEVTGAFERLLKSYNPVVIEGAGSIAELNLKNNDIVNMRIAVATKAATVLVADIERGGVFASVFGSIMLLDTEERKQIKGVIINKFRGDVSLFDEGRKILEDLTGVPVLGIIPAFSHISIEEEDSISLERKATSALDNKVNVAVIHLRRLSNFTDFNCLEQDERVNLFYTNNTEEIKKADIIILPGSKSTIADLIELRRNGVAEEIIRQSRAGKSVIGICGGYQMMGARIEDPEHVEGSVDAVPGLNILPVTTTLESEKYTVRTSFFFKDFEEPCSGYEIHMGQTRGDGAEVLNRLENGQSEGCRMNTQIWGTYMHGILDNPVVIEDILAPYVQGVTPSISYDEFKQNQYDLLADHIRQNVDMDLTYKILSE